MNPGADSGEDWAMLEVTVAYKTSSPADVTLTCNNEALTLTAPGIKSVSVFHAKKNFHTCTLYPRFGVRKNSLYKLEDFHM